MQALARLRGGSERDRGSIIVLSAVLMVSLVGMCAFAVDVGHVYNVRRQAQSAVDTSALAGGAELTRFVDTAGTRRAHAAAWVKANSYTTAEVVPGTPEEWNQAWSTCTDAGALPIPSTSSIALSDPYWPAAGGTECISFSSNMRTMRVKLPTQTISTAFASVLGVDELSTGAIAEVELAPSDEGGILPFAIYAASGLQTDIRLCLADSPSIPTWGYPFDVCTGGSSSGNFGYLNITVWGNANIPQDCQDGDTSNWRIRVNIAEGVDHMIIPWDPNGDEPRYDNIECDGQQRTPNHVNTSSGNNFAVMREGFFLGVDYPKGSDNWYEPRLTRGEYAKRRAYDNTAYDGTSGIHIDDTGLWEFLDPTIRYPDVPATCDARTFEADFDPNDHPDITGYSSLDWFYSDFMAKRNSPNPANERFVPGPRSRLHMETCLRDYQARRDGGDTSMPALFTAELAQSPRLGWLPILEGSPPSGVSAPRKVLGFRAIYVNTLFASCNGTHGCDQVWEPGEEHGGMSNSAVRQKRRNVSIPSVSRLDAMSSYAMDDYMLPPAVQQTNPTYGGGFDGIQLSR